jgi:hypothetical protein
MLQNIVNKTPTECIDKLLQIDHKRESYYRDISKNLILFVTHFTL